MCDLCWEKNKNKKTLWSVLAAANSWQDFGDLLLTCWCQTPQNTFSSIQVHSGGVRAILATNNTKEMFCFIRLFYLHQYSYYMVKISRGNKVVLCLQIKPERVQERWRKTWLTNRRMEMEYTGPVHVHWEFVLFTADVCSSLPRYSIGRCHDSQRHRAGSLQQKILLVTAGVRKSAAQSLRKWHQLSRQTSHVAFFFFKNDIYISDPLLWI